MSKRQLKLFIIDVQITCPECNKPIKFRIKFKGIELNKKIKQPIVVDCPACKRMKVDMCLNINKKIEQLKEIEYNYIDNDGRSISEEIFVGHNSDGGGGGAAAAPINY